MHSSPANSIPSDQNFSTENLIPFDGRMESLTQESDSIIQFTSGELRPMPGYVIYRPVRLQKGEIISFSCGPVSDQTALLSELDSHGNYCPLIQGSEKQARNSFSFQAEKNLQAVLNCPGVFAPDCSYTIFRHPESADRHAPSHPASMHSCSLWNRLMQSVIKVAYSSTGILINTREQFLSASLLGFDAQKSDMQLTRDNQIVMCHDDGITFNEQGRSIQYRKDDNTPIREMTRDEFCSIEYETDLSQYGYYPKHTDLDSFLRICKESNVIPYMTIRNKMVDETIPVLKKTLEKYRLQDNCIISSFPPNIENIIKCKQYLPNAAYVFVQLYTVPLTRLLVDQASYLGNVLIQIQNEDSVIRRSLDAIEYANRQGVPWGSYSVVLMKHYNNLVSLGCSMMQIISPMFRESPRRLHLPIQIRNGQPHIIGVLGFTECPSYDADLSLDADRKELRISSISYTGSANQFPDALLNIWISRLPVTVQALGDCVSSCSLNQNRKEIIIRFREIPDNTDLDLLIRI